MPPRSTPKPVTAKKPALVVDLDGTLCRTDTLHEALLAILAGSPLAIFSLLAQVFKGKTRFKKHVADTHVVAAEDLPLNSTVIDMVKEARDGGRRTALVSASDQRQTQSIAAYLGLFDDVYGTGDAQDGRNLSGPNKAAFLTATYGEKGFDYVGDARVDLPVWASARRAITLGASSGLRGAAEKANSETVHVAPRQSFWDRVPFYIRAMRPHQWSKNILVFLPILAAHDPSKIGAAIIAFIAFSLTASSVYLINDLVDLSADRAHPRKRNRPFAAGEIPILNGGLLALALMVLAVGLAVAFTPPLFLGALAAYYVTTFAYSLWLKRKLIVDILTLAGLYTARIIAGATATGIVLSPWMLGFSMFLFLSLAAVKRQSELVDQQQRGSDKTAGRAYETADLPVILGIALSAGYSAVLVMALYISSSDVQTLYENPTVLWLVCPVLIYWVSRMVIMAHRGYMTDDPIVYAAKDKGSRLVILTTAALLLVAALWT